jgi:undecaprenyl-phosphate galactose phosphotransferase
MHSTGVSSFRSAQAAPGLYGGISSWSRQHAAAVDRSFVDRACSAATTPAEKDIKRFFDFTLAVILIVVLSPALAVISLLTQLDGGPVLFGHRRLGLNGEVFVCWKFRTMVPNAGEVLKRLLAEDAQARAEWEATFKLKRDPRITAIGRFLRTTSLDELPQLLNVVLGEMSLVGPRPIVNEEVRYYGAAFHDYTCCRPGITGAWQVSGRSDVGYGQRVRLDQAYARQWSLATDIRILWKTIFVVVGRKGAY